MGPHPSLRHSAVVNAAEEAAEEELSPSEDSFTKS